MAELDPYLDLWRAVPCKQGVLEIVAIEHDETSTEVASIPKGTRAGAPVSQRSTKSPFLWAVIRRLRGARRFVGKVYLGADPVPMLWLRDDEARAAAAEGVEYEVAGLRGHLDNAVEDLSRERVRAAVLRLEFPVADGRNIGPDVFQRDTLRVHGASVAAVVLDFATAMAAGHDRCPDAVKGLGLALGEIEQAVMAGVQPAGDRQAGAHLHGDPVPEFEALFVQESAEQDIPFRKVIKEERAARLQDADAFGQPFLAPCDVLLGRQTVVEFLPYSLPRLNGGSAKIVSITPSLMIGSIFMQSMPNSAP